MIEYLNPLCWGRWGSAFVSGWFLSFPVRNTPKTIPALALIGLFFVCAFAALSQSSDWRGRLLDRQLQSAFEREDFGAAELTLNRKLGQTPDDTELLFRLAITKDALGEEDKAISLMQQLAKVGRSEKAARWLLSNKYINAKEPLKLNDDEADDYADLLKLIYKESPKDLVIKNLYANYLVATKDYAKAIPLLDDLARVQPMRGFQAALIARSMGNTATANRLANRTLGAVEKLLKEDPSNPTLALAVAQNQLFLEQHDDAVQTLNRAIARAKKDEDKRNLSISMGDAIVAWISHLENSGAASTMDRVQILKMLQSALQYAPNNPRVLTLVADQVLATMDEDSEEMSVLRRALVSGASPGIAHFIRGTAALMKNDMKRAETSLELAAKELPRSGAILNNLAVVISMKDDNNLERALQISESAIKMSPGATPHFYETRGQILFRMERYTDAIPDLEKALKVTSLAPDAHKSLAICYDKIGESDIANMHRAATSTEPGKSGPQTSPEMESNEDGN